MYNRLTLPKVESVRTEEIALTFTYVGSKSIENKRKEDLNKPLPLGDYLIRDFGLLITLCSTPMILVSLNIFIRCRGTHANT